MIRFLTGGSNPRNQINLPAGSYIVIVGSDQIADNAYFVGASPELFKYPDDIAIVVIPKIFINHKELKVKVQKSNTLISS